MINIQKKYIYFIQIKYLWQIKSSLSKVINWKERNSHNSSVLKEFYDRKYMDRSHEGVITFRQIHNFSKIVISPQK